MQKYYKESRKREVCYKQQKRMGLTGLVTSCVGTAFLKHVTEGKIEGWIEVTERGGRRHKKLLNDLEEKRRMSSIERESTRSLSVENSFWRRLWTSKTDNKMATKNGRRWSRCSTKRQQVLWVRNTDITGRISVNYFYMSKNETDLYPDVYTKIGNNILYNFIVTPCILKIH